MKDLSTLLTVCLTLIALPCAKVLGAEEAALAAATTEIIVTGVGLDPDKALKNALMNAVQQVVGAIIDAETFIKNEDIVKDQILTYSDGFVETFRKLDERKNDDGLIEVRIRAIVKRRQLVEKLKESKVTVAHIDGGSLFGEITTQYQAEKGGAELLKHAIEGLPVNLLSTTVIDKKPQIIEKNDSAVKARWFIEVKFDWNDYQTKVLPRLKEALGAAAKRKSAVELLDDGVSKWANSIAPTWLTASRQRPFWGENPGMPVIYVGTDTSREFVRHVNEVPMDREKELLILLNIGRTPNLKDRRWVWYVLDAATAKPVLTEPLHKKLMLRVTVLDSEGQPLRQVDVQVNNTRDALFSGAPQQGDTTAGRPGLGQVNNTRDALFSGAPGKWMKDVVRTDRIGSSQRAGVLGRPLLK